ncbi:MAG: kelch repeat-containing protein [Planctomycetota bacterium]
MNLRLTVPTAALAVCLFAGCNTGTRDTRGKVVYGPGSTGAPGAPTTLGVGGSGIGSFAAVGDLNDPRGQHVATLLQDGRVLVTGGTDGQGILPGSEVYDPSTDAWERVEDLAPTQQDGFMLDQNGDPTARRHHSAVTLRDGRVLVAGGNGIERQQGGQPVLEALLTCYLFNPTTNSFTATDSLKTARFLHQAARLQSGDALVLGGVSHPDPNRFPVKTGERFDAVNETWAEFPLNVARSDGVAVELETADDVLFYGGGEVIDIQQPQARLLALMDATAQEPVLYNDPTAQLQAAPPSTYAGKPRVDVAGAGMSNGDALFAGGRSVLAPPQPQVMDDSRLYALQYLTQNVDVQDTTERYDSRTKTFVPGPQLTLPRWGARCAEIGTTSDVLIVGGVDATNAPLVTCEVYGVLSDSILGTVDMSTARQQFTATSLNDGRVLVAGGLDANLMGLGSCEVHVR